MVMDLLASYRGSEEHHSKILLCKRFYYSHFEFEAREWLYLLDANEVLIFVDWSAVL